MPPATARAYCQLTDTVRVANVAYVYVCMRVCMYVCMKKMQGSNSSSRTSDESTGTDPPEDISDQQHEWMAPGRGAVSGSMTSRDACHVTTCHVTVHPSIQRCVVALGLCIN